MWTNHLYYHKCKCCKYTYILNYNPQNVSAWCYKCSKKLKMVKSEKKDQINR